VYLSSVYKLSKGQNKTGKVILYNVVHNIPQGITYQIPIKVTPYGITYNENSITDLRISYSVNEAKKSIKKISHFEFYQI
jgi:hypothetical protein